MVVAENNGAIDDALAYYFDCLDRGESVSEETLIAKFSNCAAELNEFFADQRQLHDEVQNLSSQSGTSNRLTIRCPNCHQPNEVAVDSTLSDLKCETCGSRFSVVDESDATAPLQSLPTMGRFQLVERLGMGAFGSVWKARDETLDRTVAIKIPRQAGMTAAEQEKFLREARAAAQLRHPNIVSVHEVGRDHDSVYIVSDFVPGVTLADWLTGQQLTGREAAELCALVADALEHAHERGVVHRDLKPANIMIDGNGAPHLMDFGLARRDAGEVTMTMEGQVLGTPAYMSPEQAEGKAHTADRRSDIYSLGVILFQILTGEMPFRGNARMIMHQVIHDEPPSPRNLSGTVHRDMETIVLKCLEKLPDYRYQVAANLADELRRFLRGEPIQARPINAIGRLVKWTRRNKLVSTLVTLIVVTLTTGIAHSTYFALDARKKASEALAAKHESDVSREDAVSRKNEAEAVSNFLIDAFRSAHPGYKGVNVTLVEILDQAASEIETKLPNQPRTQAALLTAMGRSYSGLGLNLKAAKVYETVVSLRENADGRDDISTVAALSFLADAYSKTNRIKEAATICEEVLAQKKRFFGLTHSQTLATMQGLANNYRLLGRTEEATDLLQQVINAAPEIVGKEHWIPMMASIELSAIYRSLGQHDKAIALCRQNLERWQSVNSVGAYASTPKAALGAAYYYAAQYDDAIGVYSEVVDEQKKFMGPQHPDTFNSMGMLAESYRKSGHPDKAIPLWEEVYRARLSLFGINGPSTARSLNGLMTAYQDADRYAEVKQLVDAVSNNSEAGAETLNALAWLLATSEKVNVRDGSRAVAIAAKACEMTQQKNPAILDTLAAAYAETGNFEQAIKASEKAVELLGDGKSKDRDLMTDALARYKANKPMRVRATSDRSNEPADKK